MQKPSDLLDTLVQDAVNSSVTASILVTKMKVVSTVLARPDIARWCVLELGGYTRYNPTKTESDTIPEYRWVPCMYRDAYSREVALPVELREIGAGILHLSQRLSELENLAASEHNILSFRDYDRIELFQSLGIPIQECLCPALAIRNTVAPIRARAVELIFDLVAVRDTGHKAAPTAVELVLRLFDHIRLSAGPLMNRRKGKTFISLEDEYDLQDVLHCLLIPWCEDIRPEEWTPSHAGSVKRMDFLLSQERVAVETKFVVDAARAKKMSDEIAIDIEHYMKHPTVESLVALIYDPTLLIQNRAAVEGDLSGVRTHDGKALNVVCRVRPVS